MVLSPRIESQQTQSPSVRGQEKMDISAQEERSWGVGRGKEGERERESPFPEFCFIWNFSGLEDACSQRWEQIFSQSTDSNAVFSGNILKDTLRNVLPANNW